MNHLITVLFVFTTSFVLGQGGDSYHRVIHLADHSDNIAPVILQQPNNAYTCIGESASFKIEARGDIHQVRWQTSIDGEEWVTVSEASKIQNFELKSTSAAHNGLFYRAIVESQDGLEVSSAPAKLFVETGLTCTVQPISQILVEHSALALHADFYHHGEVSYQWQYSPYGVGKWYDLEGETQSDLYIQKVNSDHSGGAFRVVAKNKSGCATAMSEVAFLDVLKMPLVTINKGEKMQCGGGSTTFSVQLRGGSTKEKMQWQESRDHGVTYRNIAGATHQSLTLQRISPDMTGQKYRALVTLPGGISCATPQVTLTLHGSVVFSEQPKSQNIRPGSTLSLQCGVQSTNGSAPEFVWQISTDGQYFQDIPGATTSTFKFTTRPTDLGVRYFRAVVNGGACTYLISDMARVNIDTKALQISTDSRTQKSTKKTKLQKQNKANPKKKGIGFSVWVRGLGR
jgi:hypothetical protein